MAYGEVPQTAPDTYIGRGQPCKAARELESIIGYARELDDRFAAIRNRLNSVRTRVLGTPEPPIALKDKLTGAVDSEITDLRCALDNLGHRADELIGIVEDFERL